MKKKKITKIYQFPAIIEKDEKGYFFASVPALPGCYTQGRSLEEALRNIREVITLHIEDRILHKEKIPVLKPISLSSIEVKVKV